MDVNLPVWTIRPNWRQGVLERLEWLTDVLASETGVEQRRSVRQSPRRSFEITVNPAQAERTYLDLVMHRLGSETWLFPLWHDQAVLNAAAAIGTKALSFDNTFRELRVGDYALLYRDAFSWEVVKLTTSVAGGAAIEQALVAAWPRGTKVYPLRVATVQADTTISAITSRVGQSVILFQLNEANDFAESTQGLTMYQGSPLIDTAPNRSQEITLAHTRLSSEQDGEIGLRYRTDDVRRAFAAQSHNWMIRGREAQTRFRSLLYYLRGQQRMVWLPSFNDDIFVSRAAAAGADRADIRKVGFSYIGGPIPGRERFWTGKEVVTHAAMLAGQSVDEERLRFAAPLANAYTNRSTWSFLEPARLNSDTIEIQHHTDSDGVFEVATAFKTFANTRVAGMPIYLPTPQGTMNSALCGEPGDAGLNPCYVPPSDLAMRVTYAPTQFYCNPAWDGNRDIRIPQTQPNGPGGKTIDLILIPNSNANPTKVEVYENLVVGHPTLGGQLLYVINITDFNNLTVDYYFEPNPGPALFHVFPSARYCSSANTPKDPDGLGHAVVTVARPGRETLNLGDRVMAGNSDSTWNWNI